MSERFLPREIRIEYEGRLIKPADVFDIFYRGLDLLILENWMVIDSSHSARDPQSQLHSKEGWQSAVREVTVAATIKDENGGEEKYDCLPRDDFDALGIIKRPNVFFLRSQKGEMVVLREARTYDFEGFIRPIFTKVLGKKFDELATKRFYDGSEIISPPLKEGEAMYIPEPHLLAAMECMYRDTNLPRITPHTNVIDVEGGSMWYLRPFYRGISNDKIRINNLARYFAFLRELGLMEFMDRSVDHYCYVEGGIANFDFDFFVYSGKEDGAPMNRERKDVNRALMPLEEQLYYYREPRLPIISGKDLNELLEKNESFIEAYTDLITWNFREQFSFKADPRQMLFGYFSSKLMRRQYYNSVELVLDE